MKYLFAAKIGNYTTSWDAPFIALHLLFKCRFFSLFRHLKAITHGGALSWLRVFKHELVIPMQKELLLFFKRWRYRILGWKVVSGVVQVRRMDTGRFARWNFRRQFVPGYSANSNPKRLRYVIINSNLDHLGIQGYLDSISYGIHILDPTSDLRVISCSLGLPEEIFYCNGQRKYLYRQIMKGLLPEEVLGKRIPYPQAYDIGLRLMDSPAISKHMKALFEFGEDNGFLRISETKESFESIRKWALLPQALVVSAAILRVLSLKHLLDRFQLPIKNTKFTSEKRL
jgi:hypothetical protein